MTDFIIHNAASFAATGLTLGYQGYHRGMRPWVPTAGLMLHLDPADPASYPGSGNTWYDLSGQDHNFTLVNAAFSNGAVKFSSNGYAYSATSDTPATFSGSLPGYAGGTTWSIWVKPTGTATVVADSTQRGMGEVIMSCKGNTYPYLDRYQISGDLPPWRLACGSTSSAGLSSLGADETTDQWTHLVIIHSASADQSYYVDNTWISTNGLTTTYNNFTGTFCIGGTGGDLSRPMFQGFIGAVDVWNRGLTPDEVGVLWNYYRPRYGR